jgi:HD-GYP domain-containing protein (c-di-GMP phosphodiesterase class II)
MIQTIKAAALKVGMYVTIPDKWLNHPFEKNSFPIKSRDDIQRIVDSGYPEVSIDIEKGMPVDEYEQIGHAQANAAACRKWSAENMVPDTLCRAMDDHSLPAGERAALVYESSRVLLERLFEDPRAENIKAAKQAIADIVDLILDNEDVTDMLMRITCHDFSTYSHSVNVGILGTTLSKVLYAGSVTDNLHELAAGYFLHDMGKIKIDPAIITKPGRLTDEEMRIMRTHPGQSYKILLDAGQLTEECRVIALQHHEREDGTGYPKKLKGDQIHMYARICCIVDVYDSLTSERSYKPKLTAFEALKIMKEEMLHHFHKELFEQFVLLLSKVTAAKS